MKLCSSIFNCFANYIILITMKLYCCQGGNYVKSRVDCDCLAGDFSDRTADGKLEQRKNGAIAGPKGDAWLKGNTNSNSNNNSKCNRNSNSNGNSNSNSDSTAMAIK